MVLAVHLVGCILLVVSGVEKLRDPTDANVALRHLAPRAPAGGRLLGTAEVVVGAAALTFVTTLTATAIAACYGAFALVAARLVRDEAAVGCGCFGARSAPAHPVHVAVDVVCALAAAAVAVAGWSRPALDELPAHGLGHLALLGVVAYLVFVVLTAFVDLLVTLRPHRGETHP